MSTEKSDHSVPAETVDAFAGDDLRARIFHDKYALRAADGVLALDARNAAALRLKAQAITVWEVDRENVAA